MKAKGFFGVILFLAYGVILKADIVALSERVSVAKDIDHWNAALAQKTLENSELRKKGLMECAQVKELPAVILCNATKKHYMNMILTRASIFSEGTRGSQAGNLTSTNSEAYLKIERMAVGHDIPSNQLLNFWSQLQSACAQQSLCPTKDEEEFFMRVVLPASREMPRFVVISYSLDTDWWVTVTHEMLHAQYFLDPVYRETINQFWSESVSEKDRVDIKKILGAFYNGNDEFVMKNEFQAYLLQKNPEQYELRSYVSVYRERLLRKLQEAGVAPIGL